MPTELELERAYDGWYRPRSGRFGGPGDSLLRKLRAGLATRLAKTAPNGPILDVGAGDGTLVEALRAAGRDAAGIERVPSPPWVTETALADVEGQWAGIVYWHSLEHLRGAGEELRLAVSKLSPGGILAVAMPNAASMQAAVFGDRWFALDYPRHLVHVPSSALRSRLAELGMSIDRVSYWRGGQVLFGWLDGFVGWLPGRPSLYAAIRRAPARERPMSTSARIATLAAACLLVPLALACAAFEVACRRGGTVYVEARHV
ncbi:MAG TPA: class I SAM-dependent methyltransferase [Solirubrobacterales bacterium]